MSVTEMAVYWFIILGCLGVVSWIIADQVWNSTTQRDLRVSCPKCRKAGQAFLYTNRSPKFHLGAQIVAWIDRSGI